MLCINISSDYAYVNVNPAANPQIEPKKFDREHAPCQNSHPIMKFHSMNPHKDLFFNHL